MPPKKVAAVGAGAKKKTAKNAYQMPEHVPAGSVLIDLSKQQWKIGPSIGTGGFGEIYSACSASGSTPKKPDDYPFVVKIEPHNNGPLFVEMHFYMRNAKLADIEAFRKEKRLSSFGMPHFVGSGSHDLKSTKHRFVVMPRYGKDIAKYWVECGKRLPAHTVYRLALQMLDVFEYIHKCTYVHADLKGANMLLGQGKQGVCQAYLVDFGLASHYTTAAEFKPDPKKMHNGTIEYTSRDAHCGVPTRRGDLEILAYNLVHWSGGQLPWELQKLLDHPVKVHEAKKSLFDGVLERSLAALFADVCPAPVVQYFKYVKTLRFNDAPDYGKCRKIFEGGLQELGKSNSGELDFKTVTKSQAPSAKAAVATPKKAAVATPKKATTARRAAPAALDKSDDGGPSPPHRQAVRKPAVRAARNKPAVVELSDSAASDGDFVVHDRPAKRTSRQRNETPLDTSPESLPAKKSRNRAATEDVEKENRTNGASGRSAGVPTPTKSSSSVARSGTTTISNNIESTGRKKVNKTYEFNFELDVSLDANVFINVKRKPRKEAAGSSAASSPAPATSPAKKTASGKSSAAATPLQRVLSGRSGKSSAATPSPGAELKRRKSIDSDEEIDASPDVTPVASMRVLKKDASRRARATPVSTISR